MENREVMGMGWPLGLGSMYMRLRMVERLPVAAAERRSSFYAPSSSFSSFSSSNLDTESTVSFFQDNSKTLGRLIGIRPRNNRRSEPMYTRNSAVDRPEVSHRLLSARSYPEHEDDMRMCDGICVPMYFAAKMSSRKNSSK